MILTTSGLGPHEVTAAPVGDDLLSFTLNVSRILLVITICPLSTLATSDPIGRYGGTQLFTTPQPGGLSVSSCGFSRSSKPLVDTAIHP